MLIILPIITALLIFAYCIAPGENLNKKPIFLQKNKTSFIDLSSGIRLHYLKKGSGSPVVLIHGGGTWMASYRHNINELAKRYTVYALDMPGHGFTTYKNVNVLTLQNFSDVINEFMEKLQVPKADLVGNSWGGGWILHFAQAHPAKVRKLVLIDSTGTAEIARQDKSSWKYLSYPFVGELLVHFFSKNNVARDIRTKLFYNRYKIKNKEIQDIYIPLTKTANLQAQYTLQRNLKWGEVDRGLGSINKPVLVIWGENDKYIPIKYGRKLAEKLSDATFVAIAQAGHVPQEESPHVVNKHILDFLS